MAGVADLLNRDRVNCQCRSDMFNMLSLEDLEMVYHHKSTIKFRKRESIRKHGTAMTHVIFINSGLTKVYLEKPN